jgi:hypothetical protein
MLESEILQIYSIHSNRKLLNEDSPSIVTSLYFELKHNHGN